MCVCVSGFVEVPCVSRDKRQQDSIGVVQEGKWVYALAGGLAKAAKNKRKMNGSVQGSSVFKGASAAASGGP